MEERQSDFFLDEPVAPLLSDPVYALMAEEGEEFDDDHIPELDIREQINFKRQYDSALSAPDSAVHKDVSSSVNYMVRKTAARLLTQLEQGTCTWSHAFATLERMGVDHDEALMLLVDSDGI